MHERGGFRVHRRVGILPEHRRLGPFDRRHEQASGCPGQDLLVRHRAQVNLDVPAPRSVFVGWDRGNALVLGIRFDAASSLLSCRVTSGHCTPVLTVPRGLGWRFALPDGRPLGHLLDTP